MNAVANATEVHARTPTSPCILTFASMIDLLSTSVRGDTSDGADSSSLDGTKSSDCLFRPLVA